MPDALPIVLQHIDLDIVPGKIPPIVHVSEYDTGRNIVVNLFRDGYPFGSDSIESYTVKVEGSIGKYGFSENAAWADDAEGVVIIHLTEAMTAINGRIWTKIKLIKSENMQISTCGFWLDCDRAGVEAGTVIDGESRGFEDLIRDAVNDKIDALNLVEVDGELNVLNAPAANVQLADTAGHFDADNVEGALGELADAVPMVYSKVSDPYWRIALLGRRFLLATLYAYYQDVAFVPYTPDGENSRADTILLTFPAPLENSAFLDGHGDVQGVSISNMYPVPLGDCAKVAARVRLTSPVKDVGTIADLYLRYLLAGRIATLPEHPATAHNTTYGGQVLANAKSYYNAEDHHGGSRAFDYGKNFFYVNDDTLNVPAEGGFAGRMECDTFIGLCIMGIDYANGPYALNPAANPTYAYDALPINAIHASWISAPGTNYADKNLSDDSTLMWLLRTIGQTFFGGDLHSVATYAWGMIYGKCAFTNLSDARSGDLVFWRNPTASNGRYFWNITHVGILDKSGAEPYVYEVSGWRETSDLDNTDRGEETIRHTRLADKKAPAFFARPYRI